MDTRNELLNVDMNKVHGSPSGNMLSGVLLTRILTGWGVPGSVARILAGAVLGAASALWVLAQAEHTPGLESECSELSLPTVGRTLRPADIVGD